MVTDWQRFIAIVLLAVLGAGVLGVLFQVVDLTDIDAEGAGWLSAGFLSLREIISKIEKIAMGLNTVTTKGDSDNGL